MHRRWLVGCLVASLVGLTGCTTAASSSTPDESTTSSSSTAPRSTAPTTTTTTTAAPAAIHAASAPSTTPLEQTLRDIWGRTAPGSCVMVADGPTVLYERNPDLTVLPASTMKLLTATAVLARLDPGSRLTTPVLATAGPDAEGVVHGDIWLVGGGDPVLSTLPYGAHFTRQPRLINAIEVLADRLVAAGVRRITGRVVGDDGRYERARYIATWPARYVADDETGPLSALSVNDGFATWKPTEPFADPAAGAAGVFNELLRQRGVQVDGQPTSGSFPPGAVELASLASPTIAELVAQMLLDSDNNTAELLLRELGLRVHGQGTTDAGRRAVHETLGQLGLPMDGVQVADGSGLDRGNRITCRLLVAVLTTTPRRGTIAAGLPVAAQTGTLYKRFLDTPVAGHLRAKTGSIRLVASLAGIADGAGGRQLTFAYVQNGVTSKNGADLQDQLGHALVLAPS